jgi:hypothetical protein
MSLTSDKIQKNWEDLIGCVKQTFKEDYPDSRRERLLKMYHDLESRMMFAPASGRNYYHNCFPGGYVDHVLRVINFAKLHYDLWESNGAYVDNYTREELIFVAMHHDLGKVGDMEKDYYVPNESEWHRKNQGKIYNHNPELQFMSVADRSLWLLTQFDIKTTMYEALGIRLTDGMYDDSNIQYFKSFIPEKQLTFNMPYIVHHADAMAARIEQEISQTNKTINEKQKKEFNSSFGASKNKRDKNVESLKKQFDELFN